MRKDWKIVPLRQLIAQTSTRNRADLPLLSVVRERGVIVRKLDKSDDNNNIIPDDLSNYKVVQAGQFVINKMKAWQGSCGVSPYDGIVSPAYFVFDLRVDNPHFFNYAIRSRHFVNEFNRISKGIRVAQWDLDIVKLKYVRFFLPPVDEQDQIVRYLDWKVSQISKLISVKRRQVVLLRERKLQAITDRLTNDKWQQTRIGHLYSSILGKMLAPLQRTADETLEKYLCAKDIHFEGIDITDLKEMWFTPSEKIQYKVRVGDLLVVEGGAGAGGSFVFRHQTETDIYVQNSVQIIRPRGETTNDFLYYWMFCLVKRGHIDCVCEKATIPHFTKEKVLNTPVPVVPINEQREIVTYLDDLCKDIEKTIFNLNEEIAFLAEYRTRLISDVVTGKIDVRNIVVPAYETVEESIDIDTDTDNEYADTESDDAEE